MRLVVTWGASERPYPEPIHLAAGDVYFDRYLAVLGGAGADYAPRVACYFDTGDFGVPPPRFWRGLPQPDVAVVNAGLAFNGGAAVADPALYLVGGVSA